MDFLNKAFAQLSELFRSMTPAARLTVGLLLVVVIVSLGYLFRSEVTSGADAYLMNGESISPSLLPAMEAAFDKAHLENYEIQGTKIRVPHGQQAAYIGALAEAKALPPNFGSFFREALEQGGPFDTKQQRDERNRYAIQKNLSLWISKMTNIERRRRDDRRGSHSRSQPTLDENGLGLRQSRWQRNGPRIADRGNSLLGEARPLPA